MLLEDLDYPLPESRIAQSPADSRTDSRLMVVDRKTRKVSHHVFHELEAILPTASFLVRNNASVFKARLAGRRPTGGAVECFLLKPLRAAQAPGETELWECLLKPGKRLKSGETFDLDGAYAAKVAGRTAEGLFHVELTPSRPELSLLDITELYGEVPLPPYIRRIGGPDKGDAGRYQTVYADSSRKVAAAAPTAGLHFTPELFEQLEARGIESYDLTLHVGLGTFQPVQTEHVEAHPIHQEFYEIPAVTRAEIHRRRAAGERLCAVGTTSLRAIEDFARNPGPPGEGPFQREADLFITPPATFHLVDALITNFHLPRSTLLALVGAFLTPGSTDGIPWIKELYSQAVDMKYRFFSYGDAMLIL